MRRKLTERLSTPGMRLRHLTVSGWIALVIVTGVVLFALLGPLLISADPNAQTVTLDKSPSVENVLGLDGQGRDLLARLADGARWSLAIGLGSTLIALIAGSVIGSVAATSRKVVDETIMRVVDVVMAFPGIAIAAVLVAVFGRDLTVLVAAIGFLYTPMVTRIVRANVMAQYSEDYVAAERIAGARTPFIVWRHVAKNVAAPVLVFCTVLVADAIVFEASLSFIGAGVQPPNASWGSVIADGKDLLLLGGWWATMFPGLLIFATVVALNVLSEGISDTMAAPAGRSARVTPASAPAGPSSGRRPAVAPIRGLEKAAERISARLADFTGIPAVLQVSDLSIRFPDRHDGVNVVDNVSFDVRQGEVVALIGESGCGKSLTSLAITGLEPRGAEVTGTVTLEDTDLLAMRARDRRKLMGHGVSMIYQDASSSLNPAMTVRQQLRQFTRRGGSRGPAELLEMVKLDGDRVLKSYPHELSGGQRQRVLIALALARDPKLIIADEPTTALDVTVQAEVMNLILRLQAELGFALVFVSHDLALVSDVADRVVVMYGGRVVESGRTDEIIAAPAHHYTRGLLSAVVSLEDHSDQLMQIAGVVPSPAELPAGCRFSDRCPQADEKCRDELPIPQHTSETHTVACHHPALTSSSSRKALIR